MDAEQRRPLAEMVRQRQEQWSYREMADRAHRAGHPISHSQLADYANDNVKKAPNSDQIDALAVALDMGADTVRVAVLEQWHGYTPRELKRIKDSKIAAAIPAGLSAAEEAELARLIEAWANARRRNP